MSVGQEARREKKLFIFFNSQSTMTVISGREAEVSQQGHVKNNPNLASFCGVERHTPRAKDLRGGGG